MTYGVPSEDVRRDLYLSAVLALWDKGADTVDIANKLDDREWLVERALHVALDRRRAARTQ